MFRQRICSRPLLCLLFWLTACTAYKPIELAEISEHDAVRVTTVEGTRVTIAEPRVEADSIKGNDHEGIPLDQIEEVKARKKDTASTLLLVGVGAALVTVVALRVAECASNSYGSEC